eukprot:s1103_g5.t1
MPLAQDILLSNFNHDLHPGQGLMKWPGAQLHDSARAHRAKQELHADRDVLLKRADHRVDAHSTQKDDGKNNARALLWTCGLLILPSVAYISIMLAWFFTFHDSIAKFLVGSPKKF